MSKEYIADKETLDELNQKLGVNTDAASGTSLFAKVNSLLNTMANHVAAWTSARAAKLDNLDNIGATSDTGGSTTAGTVLAKLNALLTSWTSTRAGYIDNIRSYTITNNTASKTGVLSAKSTYIISLLENATYGLSAIKSNGIEIRFPKTVAITQGFIASSSSATYTGRGVCRIYSSATSGSDSKTVKVTIDGVTLNGVVPMASNAPQNFDFYFDESITIVNNSGSSITASVTYFEV